MKHDHSPVLKIIQLFFYLTRDKIYRLDWLDKEKRLSISRLMLTHANQLGKYRVRYKKWSETMHFRKVSNE